MCVFFIVFDVIVVLVIGRSLNAKKTDTIKSTESGSHTVEESDDVKGWLKVPSCPEHFLFNVQITSVVTMIVCSPINIFVDFCNSLLCCLSTFNTNCLQRSENILVPAVV